MINQQSIDKNELYGWGNYQFKRWWQKVSYSIIIDLEKGRIKFLTIEFNNNTTV